MAADLTGHLDDATRRLPRGRHGIPPEQVAANQRHRLLRATGALIAARGYAGISVGGITAEARVSRATFYALFKDKADCVLAAQRRAQGLLLDVLCEACAVKDEWPGTVSAAISAAIDLATLHPGEIRLALASTHSPGEPCLSVPDCSLDRELVDLLERSAPNGSELRSPTALELRTAVLAAMSLLGGWLAGEDGGPEELHRQLEQIILAPYLGREPAREAAQRGR